MKIIIGVFLASILSLLIFSAEARQCTKYTSSDTIAAIGSSDYSKIDPFPAICPGPTGECSLYLQPSSALGWYGPIGALGPLGSTGPLSHQIFSPSSLFSFIGNFQDFFKSVSGSNMSLVLSDRRNPLSDAGPLGPSFFNVMPVMNDFTKHMQGLGLWSVLGPIGPLGALGPLGPLGPVGAHGYGRNTDGDYVDENDNIQTTISAVWDDNTSKQWPLYEDYTRSRAIELGKKGQLDTSFMVSATGNLSEDVYTVSVKEPQYLTILVTPAILAKNFNVQVRNHKTKSVLAVAGSNISYTPWIQLFISEEDINANQGNVKLDISVKVDPLDCGVLSMIQCFMDYYLYVTGSTSWMLRSPHIPYKGSYVKSC
ncbi:hypothetical protein ABK040_016742 [Willaertia magna]